MAQNYELAEHDYMDGMKYKDIAEKYNVTINTVKSWKKRYDWNRKGCTQNKKGVHAKKECKEPTAKEVKSVMDNPDLTDKQRLFCIYYSKSFNATKSYQKAYGCDYRTAQSNGYTLLTNAYIRDEIMKLKRSRYSKAMLEPEDLFRKYMDIAFADIADYLAFGQKEIQYIDKRGVEQSANVSYVDLQESSEVDGTILSEVSQGRDGIKVKLADRMKALEWLTAHMDMATEEQRARIENVKANTAKLKDETNRLNGDTKGNALADAIRIMEERRNELR